MTDYIKELHRISQLDTFTNVIEEQEHLRRMSLFPHVFASLIGNEEEGDKALRVIQKLVEKANTMDLHICFVLAKVASGIEAENAKVPALIKKYELEFIAALRYITTGAKALEDGLDPEVIRACNELVLEVTRRRLSRAYPDLSR